MLHFESISSLNLVLISNDSSNKSLVKKEADIETSRNPVAAVAAVAVAVVTAFGAAAAADTEIDFSGLEGRSGRSIFLLWDHLLTQPGK